MAAHREYTDDFQINGTPLPMPDADGGVSFDYQDADAPDTGRDEAGVMHRSRVRHKMGKWTFSYKALLKEDYMYLMQIFDDDEGETFSFTHPTMADPDETEETECYCNSVQAGWYSKVLGIYKDVKFSIIEV